MIDETLLDAMDKMDKAVEHLAGRVRRACAPAAPSPALVEKLKVDYYGTEVPLQQLAGFSVPEPRAARRPALRQGRDDGDREGDPAQRSRHQPEQRRHGHPARVPAAHRGAAQGAA